MVNDDIFKCDSHTTKGEPCRSLTHIMIPSKNGEPPSKIRCNFCHMHCPHHEQFQEMKETLISLVSILFGIKGSRSIFNSIWMLSPATEYSHVDYSSFMESCDDLIEHLKEIKEEVDSHVNDGQD